MRGSRATAAREGRGPTTNLCCSRYLALGRALGSCAVDTTESTVMLLPTIAFITHAVVKNCLQCHGPRARLWAMCLFIVFNLMHAEVPACHKVGPACSTHAAPACMLQCKCSHHALPAQCSNTVYVDMLGIACVQY